MGRLLKYLIMFGPMIWRMYKKFTGNRQTNNNLPQRQDNYPTNNRGRQMEGQQRRDGKWEFEEGQNPLG